MSGETRADRSHTLIAFAMHVREVRAGVAEVAEKLADGDNVFRKELDMIAEALWC